MKDDVIAIIADVLGVDPGEINEQTGAETCDKWDSLAQVVMISRMADELGVDIPFDEMMNINCAGDFIRLAGE